MLGGRLSSKMKKKELTNLSFALLCSSVRRTKLFSIYFPCWTHSNSTHHNVNVHKVIIAKIDLQCTILVELRTKTNSLFIRRRAAVAVQNTIASRIRCHKCRDRRYSATTIISNETGFPPNQFTTKRADVHATMMDVDMDSVEAPYEHYSQLP